MVIIMIETLIANWDTILQHLKLEHSISDVVFNTWLQPLKIHSVDINDNGEHLVTLSVNEAKVGTGSIPYLTTKFKVPLEVSIEEIMGEHFHIEFKLARDLKELSVSEPSQPATPHTKKPDLNTPKNIATNLNPRYTFDTFVVGSNNSLAHAASLAVAESPAEVYNPLFIYGGVGLGKTHLMHSIAHYVMENNPDAKVLYVTSEVFTNELIEAIRNRSDTSSIQEFRRKYRNIDILLIDDIQFIIGKESTQEEFFHTFNALYESKKQIIISSDKPPKEFETLEERLLSRFEWGLPVDIQSPDYETRMAILRKKAETDNFDIDDEVLSYIANNIKSNVRELEGALNKLLAYNNLVHIPITMDIAEKELSNIITPDKPREITPQLIIEVVSEHFHISVDQMISKTRSSDVAKPRQIAMYLCKNMTDSPLDTIGSLLGGRDHSTIIHGIKKVTEDYDTNETTRTLIETIKKKINPN